MENGGAVKFTSADPGPFSEYERRFVEAAEYENLGNTDVVVRYLDVSRGEAVEESVRVYQSFVVESGAQLTLVQALYEICVWHYAMQAKALEDWRKSEDKAIFEEQWADKMNKKLRVVRLLSKLQIIPSRESTTKKMDGTNTTTLPEKKPKKPSKFERYYAAMRKEGSQKTRVQLKEIFDQMPLEEKEKYGNPDAKKPSVRPQKKVPEVVTPPPPSSPSPPKEPQEDKSDDEFFSDDDAAADDDDDDDYDVNDPDDGEGCLVEFEDDGDEVQEKPPKKKSVVVDEPEGSKKRKAETTEAPPPLKAQKVDAAHRTAKASSSKMIQPKLTKPKPPEKPKKVPSQKTEKVQKVIGKEIVHDLVESERVHFLWELLSQNMNAMVEAKRPFTTFENTPFEDAFKAFSDGEGKSDEERFRSAKRVLSQTPGIKICFQMFNLLFGKEQKIEDDVDDLIFG